MTQPPELNTHIFKVTMHCGGCESAVKEALKKHQKQPDSGIKEFVVDLPTNTVTIIGTISAENALAVLEKTGKEVKLVNPPDSSRPSA